MGVSEATFYRWRKQFQGMGIAELRRLSQLEDENRKLKQLVADLTLDKHMLQDVVKKSGNRPLKTLRGALPIAGLQNSGASGLSYSTDASFQLPPSKRRRVAYGALSAFASDSRCPCRFGIQTADRYLSLRSKGQAGSPQTLRPS